MTSSTTKRNAKEPSPPAADPTVLTYLYAASKAFPKVEQIIDNQQQEMLMETLTAMERVETLDNQLETQVRRYRSEIERTSAEGDAQTQKVLFLEKQIISEDDRFESEMAEMQQAHRAKCEEIQAEIDRLKVRSDRAKAWEAVRVGKKEELATLEAKVASMKAQHKSEIKVLLANHEEERQKLRDVLVKKLRLMRDYMTTDDDSDINAVGNNLTKGGSLNEIGSASGGIADSLSPTSFNVGSSNGNNQQQQQGSKSAVKLTERLSREVTTYERESKATRAAIAAHEAQRDAIVSELEALREANERLVFKNAANTQSLKMLQKKSTEMKGIQQPQQKDGSALVSITGGGGASPRTTSKHSNSNNAVALGSSSRSPRSINKRNVAPTTIAGTPLVSSSRALTTTSANANSNHHLISSLQLSLEAELQFRNDLEHELSLVQQDIAAAVEERRVSEQQLLAQVEKDLNALEFIESLGVLLEEGHDDANRAALSSSQSNPNGASDNFSIRRSVADSRHAALPTKTGRIGGSEKEDKAGQESMKTSLHLPPIRPGSTTVTTCDAKKTATPLSNPTITDTMIEDSKNNQSNEKWVPEPVYAIGLHSEREIFKFLSVAMNCLLASVPREIIGGVSNATMPMSKH